LLAEILNVVQVFSPAQVFVTVVTVECCSVVSKQKMPKKPGKTRKYLGFPGYFFPGIFGYYPHWTLEIVVGHCQAFLIVVQPA